MKNRKTASAPDQRRRYRGSPRFTGTPTALARRDKYPRSAVQTGTVKPVVNRAQRCHQHGRTLPRLESGHNSPAALELRGYCGEVGERSRRGSFHAARPDASRKLRAIVVSIRSRDSLTFRCQVSANAGAAPKGRPQVRRPGSHRGRRSDGGPTSNRRDGGGASRAQIIVALPVSQIPEKRARKSRQPASRHDQRRRLNKHGTQTLAVNRVQIGQNR